MGSVVIGVGHCLPPKAMSNFDLSKIVETSDEWIASRTGIKNRFIVSDEKNSDLATVAANNALKNSGVTPREIDLIVVATTTPDHIFPSVATMVQSNIGAKNAFAFDIQAACSGFIYALSVADNFIKSGNINNAIVIGSETMSKIVDWQDRGTCVLFGDGAGAFILQKQNFALPINQNFPQGIISHHLFSDGNHYNDLYVENLKNNPQRGAIKMRGQEVFKHAVQKICHSVETALQFNNLQIADIDWFVPHQANIRILQSVAEKMNIPMEKLIITLDKHANTSAASIPLAISQSVNDAKIQKNHLVLCTAIGGGLTWGSCLIKW